MTSPTPRHPDLAFMLDTNAYRRLGHGRNTTAAISKASGMRAKLVGWNGAVLAHPLVLLELLSHLGDPTDPQFVECHSSLAALCALAEADEASIGLNLLVDHEVCLCKLLYKRYPEENIETGRVLQQLAIVVTRLPSNALSPHVQDLERCRASATITETQFVDDMKAHLMSLAPGKPFSWDMIATDKALSIKAVKEVRDRQWLTDRARDLARNAAHILGVTSTEADLRVHAEMVLTAFSTPLKLYQEFLVQSFTRGFDISKSAKRNTIWDIHLSYSATQLSVEGGTTLIMVSGDNAVAGAATNAGLLDKVWTFERFSQWLNDGIV